MRISYSPGVTLGIWKVTSSALHQVEDTEPPPKVTTSLEVKPVPLIVTSPPASPDPGLKESIEGPPNRDWAEAVPTMAKAITITAVAASQIRDPLDAGLKRRLGPL